MAYTTIDKPTDYFNTVLYTGNGSDNHTITGVGFQPDMIWIKERSSTSSHYLTSVGLGIGTRLEPDGTSAEATEGISAVTSDGFTIGTSTNQVNQNTITHVAWNWLAGGSTSSNTDGSITSTVSANTTSGFSVVTYTGTGSATTVGHGLGSAPAFYVIKQRNTTGGWIVYHQGNTSSPETDYLRLDKTDATVDDAIFNDTAPTSSVFSIGTNAPVNTSSGTYISYCFAEKKGYSKFGSYTGNGNANGPLIYTGFKPAWIMIKESSHAANSWHIRDNKRSTFNVVNDSIYANSNIAEVTNNSALNTDFLSNGFKLRNNDTNDNGSGRTYIYMCFAEAPFVTSTGIPTTAR